MEFGRVGGERREINQIQDQYSFYFERLQLEGYSANKCNGKLKRIELCHIF